MDKMIFQFYRVGFCEDIHTKQRRAKNIVNSMMIKNIGNSMMIKNIIIVLNDPQKIVFPVVRLSQKTVSADALIRDTRRGSKKRESQMPE